MSGAPGNPREWPTLSDYIAHARDAGFTVTTRKREEAGLPLIAVSIVTPEGAMAVEIAASLDDPLASTTIARLDRRLGRKSYLFR